MPLDSTWMVRWSRFFEIDGSRPNYSRRIGPYLSDGLGNDQIFPSFDATERVGLLYRDLFGAAMAGMWSVDALIAEIAVRRPQCIDMSRLLSDRAWRVAQLREWLAAAPAYGGLTAADIETLSNDPPLPFFILFEAMQQPQQRNVPRPARLDHCRRSDFRGAPSARLIGTWRNRLPRRSPASSAIITRQIFSPTSLKSKTWRNWWSSSPKSAT